MSNEATIQRIDMVEPVQNSDNLDKVKVLGWQVITKRNEFKVGDLCVFIMIDSILNERARAREEFKFLENKGYRIRSIKLRNCISQGIVFPLNILENITNGKIIEKNKEKYLQII